MGPTAPFERVGDVSKVVFPNGWVHDPVTDRLSLYYGAADTVVAVASAAMQDVLAHMSQTPPPLHRRATDADGWSQSPMQRDR